MSVVAAGLAIWRRTWKRTSMLALLYALPWLAFTGLFMIAVATGSGDRGRGLVGWWAMAIAYAHAADQLLAVSVERGVRAAATGVAPRTLRELGRLPSMLVCALVIDGLLVFTAFVVIPALALVPFVYVTTLVAGAERRGPRSALRRGVALSRGFRWSILGTATLLWAVRWGLTLALVHGGDAVGLVGLELGLAAAAFGSAVLSGLFASLELMDLPMVEMVRMELQVAEAEAEEVAVEVTKLPMFAHPIMVLAVEAVAPEVVVEEVVLQEVREVILLRFNV